MRHEKCDTCNSSTVSSIVTSSQWFWSVDRVYVVNPDINICILERRLLRTLQKNPFQASFASVQKCGVSSYKLLGMNKLCESVEIWALRLSGNNAARAYNSV